jgi:hypothetical protein
VPGTFRRSAETKSAGLNPSARPFGCLPRSNPSGLWIDSVTSMTKTKTLLPKATQAAAFGNNKQIWLFYSGVSCLELTIFFRNG